ncbi:hypothetical protein T10_13136 [Trichinella papuae]|uniref:Uncharacterized protein n=1 Tax=Trichinella papuae TaxID=268474 RepID=A0A0V1N8H7_9BILA|nr:hypothetical protein T10_13136 [Trichinella papuae]
MHANRFLALHYANKGRLKIALSSISNGALVCSTYVASGSVAKRSLIAAEGRLRIADKYKEWSKEKVKTWTTRSKSRTARSRTREEKRHAEACFD